MTKDELIAKQQLAIEELSEREILYQSAIDSAIMVMICIGGPLNDNVLGFTKEQIMVFHKIQNYLEEA